MYQVLARKYRPRNFIELVGQNHVSRALTSALERGRLHHAYLFTGTRGVGKTTIARILAKCLNCETGVTSTPCEVCATCKAVNEGRFIDLIEIDAASRTKVEDTRELLDNVPYAPTQGRYKVYLIDEVHMLSTHSFNALLKTLEEPPEHVKFLFATTDPQKLPITVISRCLQFTLRPLAVDEITSHLGNILNQEDIQAEQDAIWQIAESAQGSLRDALSLTDQAIAYGQGSIQHQDVKEMLGLIDRTIIFDLILAIHQNQQQHVSALLMQFRQQALDVSLVLDQFISTLHELALLQYLPDLSLKYSAEINSKIMQLSAIISAQDLQLYYQVACKGRADLQLAVTQEQGFEMCVLRLLAFRPMQPNEIPVQKQVQLQTPSVQSTAHNTNAEHLLSTAITPVQVAQDVAASASPHQGQSLQQDESRHRNESNKNTQSQVEPSSTGNDTYLSFDLDDDADLDDALSQRAQANEPSSDDYLDDDLIAESVDTTENIELNKQTTTSDSTDSMRMSNGLGSNDFALNNLSLTDLASNDLHSTDLVLTESISSESVANQAASSHVDAVATVTHQDQVAQPTHVVVEHDAEAPSLSFFGDAPKTQVESFNAKSSLDQEVFFLNPEDIQNDSTDSMATSAAVNQSQNEATVVRSGSNDSLVQPVDSAVQSSSLAKSSSKLLMPQDILALSVQKLDGEWSVDKWEYWFRNSDLSPAVQELAQQGVMTGMIDGESTFLIPVKYESILTQFQHTLENELKDRWSETKFNVRYQEISEQTPFAKQVERKVRAYSRATELLSEEDAVQSLMALFQGEIHNVQLK